MMKMMNKWLAVVQVVVSVLAAIQLHVPLSLGVHVGGNATVSASWSFNDDGFDVYKFYRYDQFSYHPPLSQVLGGASTITVQGTSFTRYYQNISVQCPFSNTPASEIASWSSRGSLEENMLMNQLKCGAPSLVCQALCSENNEMALNTSTCHASPVAGYDDQYDCYCGAPTHGLNPEVPLGSPYPGMNIFASLGLSSFPCQRNYTSICQVCSWRWCSA